MSRTPRYVLWLKPSLTPLESIEPTAQVYNRIHSINTNRKINAPVAGVLCAGVEALVRVITNAHIQTESFASSFLRR